MCKADCALLCQMPKVPSERSSCPKASIWTVPSGPAPPSRPSSSTAWRWSSSGASTWWGGSAPSWPGSSTSPRLRYHRDRPCSGCEMPRLPYSGGSAALRAFCAPAQAPGTEGWEGLNRGRARGAHKPRGCGGGIAELRGEWEALSRLCALLTAPRAAAGLRCAAAGCESPSCVRGEERPRRERWHC